MAEYQQWDLYTAYSDRLKGLKRDVLVHEFKEHANDELEHIEILQRFLVGMGINPTLERKPIPELTDTSLTAILSLQLKYERDAVDLYKKILSMLKDTDTLKLEVENILMKEQEHVHEFELLLNEQQVVVQSSFLNRVQMQQLCIDAIKELTPDMYSRLQQRKLLTKVEKEQIIKLLILKHRCLDRRSILRCLDSKICF